VFGKKTIHRKSPLKQPPLRQAGQSLNEKIFRIFNEKIDIYTFLIVYAFLIAAFEWFRWFSRIPINPLGVTFVSGVTIVFSAWKIRGHIQIIRKLKLARDGEKIVAEALENLRERGYRVFHDIIGEDFNIDHVVVGEKGIFTVETKTISKPAKGQSEIAYDGEHITIDRMSPDRDPIIQAKAQANWIRSLLKDFRTKDVPIRPVVLYPGWFVTSQPKGVEVWVLNEKALPSFIENERLSLSSEEVDALAGYLMLYLRNTRKEEYN
jgi:hypothetical protein